jgi:hypothetical protein
MMGAAGRIPHILHLHYREVVASPMAAIRKFYRHCGLDLSEIAEQRMTAYLDRPRRHSARRFEFAEFGLDPDTLRDSFSGYVRYFGVA